MSLTVEVAALTDVGCVRTNNEDSFGYDAAHHFYAVCDGMGGMASGEVASGLAIAAVLESFIQQSQPPADGETAPSAEVKLYNAVLLANQVVHRVSQEVPEYSGMGTTLVAACVEGQHLYLANVGDSRAYLIHEGLCMQVTMDHSYLNEMVSSGSMSVEEASASEMQSVITRAIGALPQVEPDLFSLEPANGDTLLLASDGLTRYASGDEIAALISASETLEAACTNLIAIAKERGGVDNITCLLLRFLANNSAAVVQASLPTSEATE